MTRATGRRGTSQAPNAPGIDPAWTSSAKDMVGCSPGHPRLRFTVGYGVVNKVDCPRIDIPQIRDRGEKAAVLLAIGADGERRNVSRSLTAAQQREGQWSENPWLGGREYWRCLQRNETAFAVLLAAASKGRADLDGIQVTDAGGVTFFRAARVFRCVDNGLRHSYGPSRRRGPLLWPRDAAAGGKARSGRQTHLSYKESNASL